jgi:hypothetical protein
MPDSYTLDTKLAYPMPRGVNVIASNATDGGN